ncbi:MAG: murein transglycosylase A [Parvularculaceae bacterium]
MIRLSDKMLARAIALMVVIAVIAGSFALFKLTGFRKPPEIAYRDDGAAVSRARFKDLEGWETDNVGEALPAFLRTCMRFEAADPEAPANANENFPGAGGAVLAGRAADWLPACSAARRLAGKAIDADIARNFFETYFLPVRLYRRLEPETAPDSKGHGKGRLEKEGRFTAYFEPAYEASLTATPEFSAPVYARPDDLVSVDLGAFSDDLKGRRIAGRVENGALKLYPDRAAIDGGALADFATVIAYMRPNDLFFLQIQGSGRLKLPNGEMRIGYDGANGRDYVAIGRTLIEMGVLTRENVSMQTISAWLETAPAKEAAKVREENASYVFFRVLPPADDPAAGPPGAAGAPLTAGRSLAVDQRYTPLGAPVWIETKGDDAGEGAIKRLLIAQDIGGAIKGGVRGDIYAGSGQAAGEFAGRFNQPGEMFVLLPRALAEHLAAEPGSPNAQNLPQGASR